MIIDDWHWRGLANLLGWFQRFFFLSCDLPLVSCCVRLLEFFYIVSFDIQSWIPLQNICCLQSSTVFSHILVCAQKLKMQFCFFERKEFHINYLTNLYNHMQERRLFLIYYMAVSAYCSQHTGLAAANFSAVWKVSGLLKYNYSLSEDATKLWICSFINFYSPETLSQEHCWPCCKPRSESLFIHVSIDQQSDNILTGQ